MVNRLLSLSTNVYINVVTNMLTGCMFEELRIASQSGTRVHIDYTKSVSCFGLNNYELCRREIQI